MQFGDPFERIDTDGSAERQSDMLFAGQLTRQLALRPMGAVATLGVRFRPGKRGRYPPDAAAAAPRNDARRRRARRLSGARAGDGSETTSRSSAEAVDRVQELSVRAARFRVARSTSARGGRDGPAASGSGGDRRGCHAARYDAPSSRAPLRHAGWHLTKAPGAHRPLPARAAMCSSRQEAAGTALECGYADQPHFIRDFTELAGCPPGAHLLRHAQLSGFFTRADLVTTGCDDSLDVFSAAGLRGLQPTAFGGIVVTPRLKHNRSGNQHVIQ